MSIKEQQDQDRDRFEAWASDDGLWLKAIERSGEVYRLMQTASAWVAWKAALESDRKGS